MKKMIIAMIVCQLGILELFAMEDYKLPEARHYFQKWRENQPAPFHSTQEFSLQESGFSEISVCYDGDDKNSEFFRNAYVLTSMEGHPQLVTLYLQSYTVDRKKNPSEYCDYRFKLTYVYPESRSNSFTESLEKCFKNLGEPFRSLQPTCYTRSYGCSTHTNHREAILSSKVEVLFRSDHPSLEDMKEYVKVVSRKLNFPLSLEQ